MWKEAFVIKFKALYLHLSGGSDSNHENPVRVAGLRSEILTRDIPCTKQEC
jgi:hypothetical protein